MKRRRINLLSLTIKKFDFETVAKKVQFLMIEVLVVLLLAIGAAAFINHYIIQEQDKLVKSKIPLNAYLQENQDFDKKIKYFIYKNNLLKAYMKEDADAFVYYNKLFTHIQKISTEATIESFTVDSVGQTQFEMKFSTYDSAQLFLNAVETPEFIKPFEYLKLESFDVSGSGKEGFGLKLEGKFIKK